MTSASSMSGDRAPVSYANQIIKWRCDGCGLVRTRLPISNWTWCRRRWSLVFVFCSLRKLGRFLSYEGRLRVKIVNAILWWNYGWYQGFNSTLYLRGLASTYVHGILLKQVSGTCCTVSTVGIVLSDILLHAVIHVYVFNKYNSTTRYILLYIYFLICDT